MMSHLCEFLRDGSLPATEAYVNLCGTTQQEAMRTFEAVMDNPGDVAWADLAPIARCFRSDMEDTILILFFLLARDLLSGNRSLILFTKGLEFRLQGLLIRFQGLEFIFQGLFNHGKGLEFRLQGLYICLRGL